MLGEERTALVAALRQALASDRVSILPEDRLSRARDLWARELIAATDGQPPAHPPDVVVWPVSTAEVQEVVRLCRRWRSALVPYGAGSGVCGGAMALGGVVMDLSRLCRLIEVDPQRRSVTFEAGIAGTVLERALNQEGWTLGHFPSSIMCSTAGGWLATRGAGQCSTRYGKIEDMVRAVEVVTGTGETLKLSGGGGPEGLPLLVGSEGTLGVITRATCVMRRLPQVRLMRGWMFAGVEPGCEAIRQLLQAGLRPAVMRLYDEVDTLTSSARRAGRGKAAEQGAGTALQRELAILARLGGPMAESAEGSAGADGQGEDQLAFSPAFSLDRWLGRLRPATGQGRHGARRWLAEQALSQSRTLNRLADWLAPRFSDGCLLILGFEGESGPTQAEEQAANEVLRRQGGRDLGPAPGEHWLRHRYDVSFKMPAIYAAGAFVDTMEVATTWAGLSRLYLAVRQAVAPLAVVMAHFSHAYADGCSIYFTFTGASGYDQVWQAALRAVVGAGATISHHHGVGQLKAPFMQDEHGGGMALLGALKAALDPSGILNPGKLGLGENRSRRGTGATARVDARQGDPWLEVDEVSLICEVAAGMALGDLERRLRARGLTLGPLPPASLARTVGEALGAPRPSEASAALGRLRDRVMRLRARMPEIPAMKEMLGGLELALPVALAPRRASGPDLKQLLIGGGGRLGTIHAATLPILRLPQSSRCAGFSFARSGPAIELLFAALDRPGVADVQGVGGEVLGGVATSTGVGLQEGMTDGVALLVRAEGLAGVVDAELARLDARAQAAGGRPLPTEICSFWLCAQTQEPMQVPDGPNRSDGLESLDEPERSTGHDRRLALWPLAEHGFFAPSPAEVGAAFDRAGGRRVLCGAYLHGMALCADGGLPVAADARSEEAGWLDRIYRSLEGGGGLLT